MKEFDELKKPSYSLRSQGNYFVRENVKSTYSVNQIFST